MVIQDKGGVYEVNNNRGKEGDEISMFAINKMNMFIIKQKIILYKGIKHILPYLAMKLEENIKNNVLKECKNFNYKLKNKGVSKIATPGVIKFRCPKKRTSEKIQQEYIY